MDNAAINEALDREERGEDVSDEEWDRLLSAAPQTAAAETATPTHEQLRDPEWCYQHQASLAKGVKIERAGEH
jgi:hypothetical protein